MKLKKVLLLCALFIISMLLICGTSYAVTDEEIFEYDVKNDGTVTIKGVTDLFPSDSDCVYFEDGKKVLKLPDQIDGKDVDSVLIRFDSIDDFQKIVLPKDLKIIASYVFKNCKKLENVEIPSGVTKVGSSAFYGCINLKSIELPEKTTKINDLAFAGCSSLKEVKNLDKVKKIGFGAFLNCEKLKKVKLSDKIKIIEDSTFEGCSSLEDIELSKNVQKIKPFAFNNCDNLENVIINNSKTEISQGAFEKTDKLTIHGHKVSTAHSYAESNKIAFEEISEMSQVEKAGILMASFLTQCVEQYGGDTKIDKYGGYIQYGTTNRHLNVFYREPELGELAPLKTDRDGNIYRDAIDSLDCVGCVNLYVYQSTGLWSSNFTDYTDVLKAPTNDNMYIGPKNQNSKLKATDLFEYIGGTSNTNGYSFSTLKECAANGTLKPGDLLTMTGHVAMYAGWNGTKMLIGENYKTTNAWSNFTSTSINWSTNNISVARIKEEAANELTFLYDMNEKEEIEKYGRALADAYFNGSTTYNGQTLYRKVYYKTHIMVGDNTSPDLSLKNKKVQNSDGTYKTLPLLSNCEGMTVKDLKMKLLNIEKEEGSKEKKYARVEILDKDGNVITDEDTIITTDMKARCYKLNETAQEVGASQILYSVGEEGIEDEEVDEYSVVVYGDVTGKGDPGAIDALAIVKNNTGKIPFTNEVYLEAGRVTRKSRENDLIPSSVDAFYITSSKLGRCEIEQGEFEDIEIIEEDENVIPLYTREDLENVGSGKEYISKTTHEAYVMETDAKYILMADIDLGEEEWTPIGKEENTEKESTILTNEFNGNGHTIKNLKINCSNLSSDEDELEATGFFSVCKAKVYDLNFENAQIEYNNDSKNIGILAGKYIVNDDSEDYILDDVNIKLETSKIEVQEEDTYTNENIGGIVGIIEYEDDCDKVIYVRKCENEGNITGNGGIIGTSKVNIKLVNCKNLNNIHSNYGAVGGIVGIIKSDTVSIIKCENSGLIENSTTALAIFGTGGIVGRIENTSKIDVRISSCTNNGYIKGYCTKGGIIGYVCVYGDVINENKVIIINCENTGEILKNDKEFLSSYNLAKGGIVGEISSVNTFYCSNCKNSGKITNDGTAPNGGIIGLIYRVNSTGKSQIVNCYNSGDIEGETECAHAGGIIGEACCKNDISILGCINDGNIKAKGMAGGIIGDVVKYKEGNVIINGCKNNGNVLAKEYLASGILCYLRDGHNIEITNNTNTGTISCPGTVLNADSGDIYGCAGAITGCIGPHYECEVNLDLQNNSNSGSIDMPNSSGYYQVDPLYGCMKYIKDYIKE